MNARRYRQIFRSPSWREAGLACVLLLGLAAMGFGGWQLGQGLAIKAKAAVAQILLERAWARARAGEGAPKPWPWADTWPVAQLEVPRLGRSVIVLNDASGEAMAFGPGHLANTPLPGERGTSVLSAHRDTHFAFLRHMQVGDEVRITRRDETTHRFTVTGHAIVHAANSGIDPLAGNRRLALVTCWPFDAYEAGGPLRYVVIAEKTTTLAAAPSP